MGDTDLPLGRGEPNLGKSVSQHVQPQDCDATILLSPQVRESMSMVSEHDLDDTDLLLMRKLMEKHARAAEGLVAFAKYVRKKQDMRNNRLEVCYEILTLNGFGLATYCMLIRLDMGTSDDPYRIQAACQAQISLLQKSLWLLRCARDWYGIMGTLLFLALMCAAIVDLDSFIRLQSEVLQDAYVALLHPNVTQNTSIPCGVDLEALVLMAFGGIQSSWPIWIMVGFMFAVVAHGGVRHDFHVRVSRPPLKTFCWDEFECHSLPLWQRLYVSWYNNSYEVVSLKTSIEQLAPNDDRAPEKFKTADVVHVR